MGIYETDPHRIRQHPSKTCEDPSTIMTYLTVLYHTNKEHEVREFWGKLSKSTRDNIIAFIRSHSLCDEWATRAEFILMHLK